MRYLISFEIQTECSDPTPILDAMQRMLTEQIEGYIEDFDEDFDDDFDDIEQSVTVSLLD